MVDEKQIYVQGDGFDEQVSEGEAWLRMDDAAKASVSTRPIWGHKVTIEAPPEEKVIDVEDASATLDEALDELQIISNEALASRWAMLSPRAPGEAAWCSRSGR
ncbi:hypothetical protein [Nonomuraea sp. CA-141351]|uniref:hypothetical protein n=1 Tax=Nonomuraea sp. CA-141351 TaxID=3239996 RepID=UPI003D8CCDFF